MPTPPKPIPDPHPSADMPRPAWIGPILLVLYLVLYAAFILGMLLAPAAMSETALSAGDRIYSFGGPNLAVVSGIGLILAGILLSLVNLRLTGLTNTGRSG